MTLSELEQALVTTITGLGKFKTVESFKGSIEDILKNRTARWPACFVVYQGAKYQRVASRVWRKTPQYSLLICAQSYRSESDARLKPDGANALLDFVEAALLEQYLGLELEQPLYPVEQELLNMVSKETGMALAVYDCRWEAVFTAEPAAETAATLAALEARYKLRPGDDTPDAIDQIDLEG